MKLKPGHKQGHWGSCASIKVKRQGHPQGVCDCNCKYIATPEMLAQSNTGGIRPRATDIQAAKTEATDYEIWRG